MCIFMTKYCKMSKLRTILIIYMLFLVQNIKYFKIHKNTPEYKFSKLYNKNVFKRSELLRL